MHVASGYSFKYGTAHVDQLVERAAKFEMTALALTDRDGMPGAIRFVQSCESNGRNPPSPGWPPRFAISLSDCGKNE